KHFEVEDPLLPGIGFVRHYGRTGFNGSDDIALWAFFRILVQDPQGVVHIVPWIVHIVAAIGLDIVPKGGYEGQALAVQQIVQGLLGLSTQMVLGYGPGDPVPGLSPKGVSKDQNWKKQEQYECSFHQSRVYHSGLPGNDRR